MSRSFFVLLLNEKIIAAPRLRSRDVCTHRALRLTSYINVNAPLGPANSTDEVRKKEEKERTEERGKEREEITKSWIYLSGEDGRKKKKKRKNRTL